MSHSRKIIDAPLAVVARRWGAAGGKSGVRRPPLKRGSGPATAGRSAHASAPFVALRGGAGARKRAAGLVAVVSVAILCSGGVPLGAAAAQAADATALLVVVHPSNPVAKLSNYEIARIFRGEMLQWPDGRRVQVIDYTEDRPERRTFYHSIYHSGPHRQRPRGSPYVFRPLEQSQPDMVRRLVGLMPNAVAYLPADADTSGLKIVARIDGVQ